MVMLQTKLLLLGVLFTNRLVVCQEILDDQEDNCQATRKGCTCEFVWEFNQLELKGCNNPDKDPSGLWCMVNIESCDNNSTEQVLQQQIQFEGQDTEVIRYYDYCNANCPTESGFPKIKDECRNGNQTLIACSCQNQWTLGGELETYEYCENPDNDPGGSWCKIDESLPCDFDELVMRNQLTRNRQTNEILSYWDYCNQECGGLVRPETFMQNVNAPTQQSTASSGTATQVSVSPTQISSMPSPIPYLASASPVDYVPSTSKISIEQGVANEAATSSSSSPTAASNGPTSSRSSGGFTGSG